MPKHDTVRKILTWSVAGPPRACTCKAQGQATATVHALLPATVKIIKHTLQFYYHFDEFARLYDVPPIRLRLP